jgi:hypothetical protein
MLKINKYDKINKNDKIIKIKVLIEPKLNRYGYIKIGFFYNNISARLYYKYDNWFYCNFISYTLHLEDIDKMPGYNEGNENTFDIFVKYIINNWNSGKYNEKLSSFNEDINSFFSHF